MYTRVDRWHLMKGSSRTNFGGSENQKVTVGSVLWYLITDQTARSVVLSVLFPGLF